MKAQGFLSLISWDLIGLIICIGSVSLKLDSFSNPGPGMFPFLIGSGIILLATIQLVIEVYHTEDLLRTRPWPHFSGLKKVIWILVLLVFYAAFVDRLGFFLCTLFFLVTLFKTVGQKSWIVVILYSIPICILSYVLFQILLKINLPKGSFWI